MRTTLPPKNGYKSQSGLTRVVNACRYSVAGLIHAWQNEAAFRQEIYFFSTIFLSFLFVSLSSWQKLLLLGSMGFVLVVELINSAIEAVADRLTLEEDPSVKAAKDMGSAAVFLGMCWVLILWISWVWVPLIRFAWIHWMVRL
jgi:diacylglycerol kinase (ATP)